MEQGGAELNWQQQELMAKPPSRKKDCWADSEMNDDVPDAAPPRERSGSSGGWGASKDEGIKLYVGNLAWQAKSDDLGEHFSQFGECLDVVVVEDRETGSSRGFGFVYMANQDGADEAIAQTNEQDFMGRTLRVNIAEEKGGKGGSRGGKGGSKGSGARSYGFNDRGGGGDRGGYGRDDRDGGGRQNSESNDSGYDRTQKYGGSSRIPEGRWR